MPISLDDQARLPPLTPYDEVAERQRLADMKAFRQYLVETGTAKCLVKLYSHIAKNEMRLDNANILKEFLAEHVEETEETREVERITRENETLRAYQGELQSQAETLSKELEEQQRLSVGRRIWKHFSSSEFWEGELDDDALAAGISVNFFYRRLCGQKVDKGTRQVLVDLLQPVFLQQDLSEAPSISCDRFATWVAKEIPDYLHDWCRDDLLPRLTSVPVPNEPPFERELLQAIRETGLVHPDHLEEIPTIVFLDDNLLSFLDNAVEAFKS